MTETETESLATIYIMTQRSSGFLTISTEAELHPNAKS